MTYQKTNWENLPSTQTPINAANLNKIEDQLLEPAVNYIDFDLDHEHDHVIGRIAWNKAEDTANIHHSNNVVQQVGEEFYARVTNNTGSTIENGTLVGLTGAGTQVGRYVADGTAPPIYALGLATHDIPNGTRGRLTVYGRVRGLDTSGFQVGNTIYANPSMPGGLTNIKPTAPNIVIPVGVVTASDAENGEIFIRPILDQQLYYGAFARTTDLTPALIDTPYAVPLDTTIVSNGVTIADTTKITVAHSGLYNINVTFQLTSTNSSIKNVFMWFRKNGVDVPYSTIIRSLESGTAVAIQNLSRYFSLAAGDYIEIMWAADSTAVILDARAASAFHPSAPAVSLTVDQIQQ